ncbi:RNA polymerase sigma factor [Cryptosporangium minutisporangium]|uniref:SigE family RNA polymerase sigma factor n=1 Tax=Cryptosporangium minutisporangium TaxID=113569 RepID=A0ABP6T4J8_9ACTN
MPFSGDPGAEQRFDEFYAANFAALAAQITVYLGDRAEAEDITQEAFCRAWRHWPQISGGTNPVGWVHTVAYRLAVSRWRRLRVAVAHRLRHRPQSIPPPDGGRLDLQAALATLPDAQRRVVVLHYLADLGVDEIAAREGVPVGTVKSWLHRGRARLATALDREGAAQ